MYKLNSLDWKRNPDAVLQPLKPASGSVLSGRIQTTAELKDKDDDDGENEPHSRYNEVSLESNRNTQQFANGAYVFWGYHFPFIRT